MQSPAKLVKKRINQQAANPQKNESVNGSKQKYGFKPSPPPHSREYRPQALASFRPTDKKPRKIVTFLNRILAMLLRWKWLIMLTTLMISLVGVVTFLFMQPDNITISTVLLAGMLSGLFLGTIIASIREWRNSLLVSQEELQNKTGYPVIGVIPEVKRGEQYLAKEIVRKPYSRIAEAYRLAATLLLHGKQHTDENKVLLVTSINVGEGKSVSASNLALSFSDLGAKVLLIDADFRMPSVHFKLGIQNKPGLINYLLGQEELSNITQHVATMPGLYVITAGSALDFSPVNLLSRNRMTSFLNSAKKYFDYVIIDAPPIRGFADTLLLHSMANSTLVVVSEKKAQIDEIKQNLKSLTQVKQSIVGLLKIRANKDIVDREYYKNYSRESFQQKLRFKKNQKLNLGNNK